MVGYLWEHVFSPLRLSPLLIKKKKGRAGNVYNLGFLYIIVLPFMYYFLIFFSFYANVVCITS